MIIPPRILVALLLTVLLIPQPTQAANAVPRAVTPPGLQHEPVQPLLAPTNLDPRKVSLGQRLFHEPRFGRDNDMACDTCHKLSDNGADHHSHTPGRGGVALAVNTLTVFNSSFNHRQFWDGRAATLEEQINFVVSGEKEFATRWPVIVSKLKQDANYRASFRRIYSDGITAANIRDAIATFERSLVTLNSRFDNYLLGDADAISPAEKVGYRLFKDYGCVACHQGKNVGGNLFMKFGVFKDYFAERGNLTSADLGRFNITGKERDRHVFRVPSLRLAALTAPYFHDGSVDTLEEAVKIMAEHQLGRKIPQRDVERIVAFLKTLPGEYRGRPLGNADTAQEKRKIP